MSDCLLRIRPTPLLQATSAIDGHAAAAWSGKPRRRITTIAFDGIRSPDVRPAERAFLHEAIVRLGKGLRARAVDSDRAVAAALRARFA